MNTDTYTVTYTDIILLLILRLKLILKLILILILIFIGDYKNAACPVWAIYRHLGDFSKHVGIFLVSKSQKILAMF